MNTISKRVPVSPVALRQAIYSGEIFCLSGLACNLVTRVGKLVAAELGSDYRRAQYSLTDAEFLGAIARLRQQLLTGDPYRKLLLSVMNDCGFQTAENAFDHLRLRAVKHLGHENPAAAAAYGAHRDTWYANPQAQINWWIPLHDVSEQETFHFLPALFNAPVDNDSARFNYAEFKAAVGFGSITGGTPAVYPSLTGPLPAAEEKLPFSCRAGDVIMFAAAQLHQTRPNQSGLTRFSLDFRSVHLADHAGGIGAPNTDNRSCGSALPDYVHPA